MGDSERTYQAGKVAVIGSGSWGTAVTALLAPHAREVWVWSHEEEVAASIRKHHRNPCQVPFFEIPANVTASVSHAEVAAGAEAVLLVVPSAFIRATARDLAPHLAPEVPVLVLTKGVEMGTGALMADIAAEELGDTHPIAVLSGPNHAEEIARHMISAAVIASADIAVAEYFQSLLECREFRLYVTRDVIGVEVCAAVKNVIAIACGIAVATGAGDNALAALMTRGVAEVSRVTCALGGEAMTCMGLAGMGDLIVTCISQHSRNRTFGEAFVAGESLADYQRRTGMVVEGAEAARSVRALARARSIQVPITDAVCAMLFEGVPIREATDGLLGRVSHDEFYDVR